MDLIANRSRRLRCFSLKKKKKQHIRGDQAARYVFSPRRRCLPPSRFSSKKTKNKDALVADEPGDCKAAKTHTHFHDANSHRRLKKKKKASLCLLVFSSWQIHHKGGGGGGGGGGEGVYVCVGKKMGTVFFRAPIQKLAPLPLRWVLPLTRPFLSVWCLCQFLSVSLSFSNLIILLWTLSRKGLTLLAEQAGEASLRG